MFYFKAFLRALYDHKWMRKNRHDMGRAGAYFVFFVLFLSALYAGFFSWKIPRLVEQYRAPVMERIPEFEMKIEQGRMRVDKLNEPYVFTGQGNGEEIVVVVDTQTDPDQVSLSNFVDTDSQIGFMLLRDRVLIHDPGQNQTRVQYYDQDLSGVSLTRSDMDKWANRLSAGLPYFVFFLILLGFFAALVIGKLVYLAIISLVIWTSARLGYRDWTYKQVYTLGLYAVTLPSLAKFLFDIFGHPLPYIYTILLLTVMMAAVFMGVKNGRKDKRRDDDKRIY